LAQRLLKLIPSLINRKLPAMIRDTSAQDRRIEVAPARNTKRLVLIGAACAAVLAALIWVVPGVARLMSAGTSASSASLRIAQVKRGTLTRDISAQGKIVAAQSPTLYATAPGTITLLTHAGDKVEKDQILAEVDSPELKNKLEQEQATLSSLDVDVERAGIDNRQKQLLAKKTIDQAQIDRITAAREVDRNERGFKLGAIPEINVLRAKDALAKSDLDVAHAQADAHLISDTGTFELKTKRLALDRQHLLVADLMRQVDLLKVRSPVAGQVGQLLVQQKANVAANTGLVTVIDLTSLEVELQVPEVFAHDLAISMPAEIADGAEKYTGEVSAVSPEVVDNQVIARVRFGDRKPPGLRQNQRLTTRILIDEHPNVLLVERGSFVDSGAGRVAYLVHDGIAERKAILVGATSLNAVELVSGVKEGDRIVISGTDTFNGAEKVVLN
jgi:HlyD family secretion protein